MARRDGARLARGESAAHETRYTVRPRRNGRVLANSAENWRGSRALGPRGLIRIPPRRFDEDRARFNLARRNEQRRRRQHMQPAAKWTKPAIGSVAAFTRRNAVFVVAAIRVLAGRDSPQCLNMGVTYSPLPRDDKRDSEEERGQESAPCVHCFGSAKKRKGVPAAIIGQRSESKVKRRFAMKQLLL